jgi:thiol-disulfide isomerase/thioredoxin
VKELDYLTMLQTGYRMAGDKKSQREIEDRIVAEYPDSSEADFTASRRFEDEHPYPKDEDSVETKQAYYRLSLADADARLKKNPQDTRAVRDRFEEMEELDEVSNEEIANAGEALRAVLKGELNWYTTPPMDFSIARTYLDRKIRVEEVADLVAEGRAEYTRRQERPISDRETDELRKALATNDTWVLLKEAELLVDASRALQKPEIAKDAMEKLSAEKIDVKYFQIELWEIKGKWAELNGRKLDAVLMYRASLDSRVVGYKPRGKKDDVKEAYERLWKELGGTDSGNDAWLAATAGAKIVADGGWERVSKDLPDAKLVDLNGKTWTLSELKGKKVLINVWASWCGPCRGEHPYLQALYDKVKDRKDIAVVSMSIDESIGDVEPYIKEKKYSFPVLLASRYVNDVAPAFGVPQNWIVGADGKWEWKQEGFGDGGDWEKSVMEKLEGKDEKDGVGKK